MCTANIHSAREWREYRLWRVTLICLRRRVECGDSLTQEGQLVGFHEISLHLRGRDVKKGALMCGGAGLRQSVPRAGATCTRAAAVHLVEDEDVGALDLLAHELHHLPSAFPGLGRAEVGALLQLVPLLKLLLLRCGAVSADKPVIIPARKPSTNGQCCGSPSGFHAGACRHGCVPVAACAQFEAPETWTRPPQ